MLTLITLILQCTHWGMAIFNEETDKGSEVLMWDREDYIKEANKQLSDMGPYQELNGYTEGPIISK